MTNGEIIYLYEIPRRILPRRTEKLNLRREAAHLPPRARYKEKEHEGTIEIHPKERGADADSGALSGRRARGAGRELRRLRLRQLGLGVVGREAIQTRGLAGAVQRRHGGQVAGRCGRGALLRQSRLHARARPAPRGRRLSGGRRRRKDEGLSRTQDLQPVAERLQGHEGAPGQGLRFRMGHDREGRRGRVYSGFRAGLHLGNARADRDSGSHGHALHGKRDFRHSDGGQGEGL